ncbi:DUF928 domain-containing protein [Oxynema sp. CENA135]|nr:DUF928 domain-containing protein [Oxynema sp. CENA135]
MRSVPPTLGPPVPPTAQDRSRAGQAGVAKASRKSPGRSPTSETRRPSSTLSPKENVIMCCQPIVKLSILAVSIAGLSAVGAAFPVRAVEFNPPDVGTPERRVGGGTRSGSSSEIDTQVGIFQPRQPGAPDRRIGGGSRGCSVGDNGAASLPLTAIVPESLVSLTVSQAPTFFWYVPEHDAPAVEFALLDEERKAVIYESIFQTRGQAGLISLQLPENANLIPLELNKKYRWYFSIVCDPEDRAGDIAVEGWIQRVEPSAQLQERLAAAQSDGDRAAIYAQEGIWHETIALLVQQRLADPDNPQLEREWNQLLQSIGLDHLAQLSLWEISEARLP